MKWAPVLGNNIRRLRLAKGLSQEKLAAKAGIDMRYLGGIERAEENPTMTVVCGIAQALGVHPSTLLLDPRSK